MSLLYPNYLELQYIFCSSAFPIETLDKAISKNNQLIKQCEDFADSIHIHCHGENFSSFNDNKFSLQLIFNVKGSQDEVLPKVSALFAFAASVNLFFVNQFFSPE